MWADAVLIFRKDFRVEWRARVVLTQIAPFTLVTLILFGIAFDADRNLLVQLAPGLVWVVVLFAAVLSAQRSFAMEQRDGTRDALAVSALDPAGIFLGKLLAVSAQLLAIIVFVLVGALVLFGSRISQPSLLVVSSLLSTVGLAAIAVLYGALISGLRGGETAFPILVLPVAAPVLLVATRAWEDALGVTAGSAWGGIPFLGVFAVVFIALGVVAFGWMMEPA